MTNELKAKKLFTSMCLILLSTLSIHLILEWIRKNDEISNFQWAVIIISMLISFVPGIIGFIKFLNNIQKTKNVTLK